MLCHLALVTEPMCCPELRAVQGGLRALGELVFAAHEARVRYLTLSTFSGLGSSAVPRVEQAPLAGMLLEFALANQSRLIEDGIRVSTIGNLDDLPTHLRRALESLCDATRAGNGLNLTLPVAYAGRADIVDAARCLATLIRAGRLLPEEVDERMLRAQLASSALPPVELAIYTGGAEGRDFLPFEIDGATKLRFGLPMTRFRPKHLAVALELYGFRPAGCP